MTQLHDHRDLLPLIPQLRGKKLLIIGDVGLDEYVEGEVRRISPEAPVPILEVSSEEKRLGLAANVAQNISSLGGIPLVVAVVGQDLAAEDLKRLFRDADVSDQHLIEDKERPTTRKLRVISGHHHLVRVDYEKRQYLSEVVEKNVLKKIESLIPTCDAVILQDYAKGVLSEALCQKVIKLAKTAKKRVLVDPYRSTPVRYYLGADLMTPNHDESLQLAGWVDDGLKSDQTYVEQVGKRLMQGIESDRMIITLGKEGMRLFENGASIQLPTYARQVFDVTGAGDTVIAVLALGWASGLSLENSCRLANMAAGVVVGKVGCVPCRSDELEEYIISTSTLSVDG